MDLLNHLDFNIEELFYMNWENLSLKKEFISQEDAFNVFQKFLDSENLMEVSDEYAKYLNIY